MAKQYRKILPWVIASVLVIVALTVALFSNKQPVKQQSFSLADIPAFSGEPFVVIGGNQPEFTQEDITAKSYEYYSKLDSLDRCGYAMACIGIDLMPTEDRESISSVKPSGWIQAQYDWVDGKSLYNRCHLIGFQLTGENANERNLITGTRFFNVEGMLPFENMVADYIKETGNHVLYRVTPIYNENELVARGVQMEAWSVEDKGEGICFNVYVYNNQPGVIIDYQTGQSSAENNASLSETKDSTENCYILNINSKKFHKDDCNQGNDIKDSNKEVYEGSRDALLEQGYDPAKCCNP